MYKLSKDKNSKEIKIKKEKLNETCKKGLELYNILNEYFDSNFDDDTEIENYFMKGKKVREWYKIYKNKDHEVRIIIRDTLNDLYVN